MLKAAFIFLAPGADASKHRAEVVTEAVHLITVGVADYAAAAKVARELLEEGVGAFELCGGFGHLGTAAMAKAIEGKAALGVVRFDCHPGLGGKSGDALFGEVGASDAL